jgi:hypothetical protein
MGIPMSIREFFGSQFWVFLITLIYSNHPIINILLLYILPIVITVLLYKYKKKFAWFSIIPPVIMYRLLINDSSLYLWTPNHMFSSLFLVIAHFTILVSLVILIMFIINKIKLKVNNRK